MSAELQCKALGLWLCDDEVPDDQARQVDIGRGVKPPGYYVQRSCGLFPSPHPQDSANTERVEKLFHFMGTLFAKCIQDSRLVDIPLSRPFLKLMCMGDVVDNVAHAYRELLCHDDLSAESPADDDLTPTEETEKEIIYDPPKKNTVKHSESAAPWYAGLLTHEDFMVVDPVRARFLQQLNELSSKKMAVLSDRELNQEQRNNRLQELTLSDPVCKVEDLG